MLSYDVSFVIKKMESEKTQICRNTFKLNVVLTRLCRQPSINISTFIIRNIHGNTPFIVSGIPQIRVGFDKPRYERFYQ